MKNIITFLLLTFSLGASFVHSATKPNEHAKIWKKSGFKRSSNRPCKCCDWHGSWYYTEKPCQHCKDDVVKVTCGSGFGEYTQMCYGDCPHGKQV